MAGYTQQDVMKKFMASFDTTTLSKTNALDEAVRACSNFGSIDDAINQMISDCETYNAADTTNGWKNFLLEKCGINLDNNDTGAISGLDAGGAVYEKTAESVVPENDSFENFTGSSFTTEGATFTLTGSLDTEDKKFIWSSMYSYWAKEALTLLKNSYGYSFEDTDTAFNEIRIFFTDNSNDSNMAGTYPTIFSDEQTKSNYIFMYINLDWWHGISNDSSNTSGKVFSHNKDRYLDRTFTHELTHAIMNAKVYDYSEITDYISEGLAELVHGIDDERKGDIEYLAQNPSFFSTKFDSGDVWKYSAGYILLRYIARQSADEKTLPGQIIGNSNYNTVISGSNYADHFSNYGVDNVTIYGGAGNDTVSSYGSNVNIFGESDDDSIYLYTNAYSTTVNAGTGDDEIYSGGKNISIDAGTGDDYVYLYTNAANTTVLGGYGDDEIYSGGTNVSIDAGTGNDYIHLFSQTANNIINGGAGNDTIRTYSSGGNFFQYDSGGGNDIILGYDSNDTLHIRTGSYVKSTVGEDVVIKVDSGAVTLGGASGKTINIIGTGTTEETDAFDETWSCYSGRNMVNYGGYKNILVENFVSGMADYSDVAVLYNGFSTATRNGYNVDFTMANGNKLRLKTDTNSGDDAILYSGDGTNFYSAKIADSSATNITYYPNIHYYGLSQFGTLNLIESSNHNIWLDGRDGTSYLYIANVDGSGSSGNDYLAGNSGNNSIIAGSGESTLWGGNGGDDTLVGGSAKDYFRFTGEGNDVVVDFTSGMASNSDAMILPEYFTASRANNILTFNAPNGYTMQVQTDSYSGDDAILYSGDGSTFYSAKFADSSATRITHYNNIKYYGLAQWGTLDVINDSDNNIRLDGSDGVSYLYVMNIDASTSTGNNVLFGSSGYNEIRGGRGTSVLWGGQYDGTADVLIGGSGVDIFIVGQYDGNDTVSGAESQDIIYLHDVNFTQLVSSNVSDSGFTITTETGSQISVNNSDNLSCAFWTEEGLHTKYNRSTNSWVNVT